jgi:tetratricopeptide (TPR) repeat protein
LKDLRIKLLLNLAACYLKEKQLNDSIKACDEVLKLDPESVKALFRRSKVAESISFNLFKARLSNINAEEEDYVASIDDLKRAQQIEPNNSEVARELAAA